MSLKISILVGLGLALPLARYASVAGATREKVITAGAVGSWRWGAIRDLIRSFFLFRSLFQRWGENPCGAGAMDTYFKNFAF